MAREEPIMVVVATIALHALSIAPMAAMDGARANARQILTASRKIAI